MIHPSSGTKGLSIVDTWMPLSRRRNRAQTDDATAPTLPDRSPSVDRSRKQWLARVRVPGTTRYLAKRFDTRAQAEKWGDPLLARLKAGTETAEHAYLDEVSGEYCRQLRGMVDEETKRDPTKPAKEAEVSEGYVRHIELVVAGLTRAGIRDMKAKTFQASVRNWIAGLKPNWWATGEHKWLKTSGKPLSNSLRNRMIREVRALCHHAQSTRRITYNALDGIKPFKVAKHLKPTFSMSQLRDMVSDKNRSDPWWLPACLSVYTGCRIQESMHLRWEDIDWASNRIRVRLQDVYQQKNDQEREVPLQVELRAILQPIAKVGDGFIIEDQRMRANGASAHLLDPEREPAKRKDDTKPVHPDYTPALCKYLKRIGIEPGKGHDKRTAHSLRHSWISLMLVTLEPPSLVARWAGHGKDVQDDYANSVGRYSHEASRWPRGEFYIRREQAAPAAMAAKAIGG